MIEITELTKRYGDRTAVDGLSFTVRPGHVTGFLGPNGAGKSTTMRVVLGLDRATTGTATVGGRPYRSLPAPLHEVGALLEARAVHGGRTARDHLRCLARSNGIGRRRVEEVLDLVGLADVAGRRANGFSLGMAQRLGIASALLGDPGVLLLDEPVNGLDTEGIRWVRSLLRGLAAEGRTILLSSHLMSEMELTADHLVVIGQGRLLADEPMGELIAHGSAVVTVVRTPQPAQLAELISAAGGQAVVEGDRVEVRGLEAATVGERCARHGIVLHELSSHRSALEEVYTRMTERSVEHRAVTPSAAVDPAGEVGR